MQDFTAGANETVRATNLWIQPHKGKPCALLLGRDMQQLHPPWRLQAGDIFTVGRSRIRVVQRTTLGSKREAGSLRSTSHSLAGGRRQPHAPPAAAAPPTIQPAAAGCEPASHPTGGPLSTAGRQPDPLEVGPCVAAAVTVEMAAVEMAAVETADAVEAAKAPPLATEDGPYVLVEDTGKRYRRKANKEKRRQRKLSGDSSSDSEDENDSESSEAEHTRGRMSEAFMKLELVDGPWRGRRLEFGAAGLSIGASKRCGLDLHADLNVSSMHAHISHSAGEWYLADCGSAAGTFLLIPDGGMRIDAGDCVRIGKTEITFYMQPHLAC